MSKGEHTYWASKFDVSKATLRAAIEAVGPEIDELERHIEALKRAPQQARGKDQPDQAPG